ncbi:MAG: flavoprotein, partial [Tumebacillaceae bacterium]
MAIQKVLVGVAGSIGAVEVHNYLHQLRSRFDCSIQVILTESAADLINSDTLRFFIDGDIYLHTGASTEQFRIPHIHLTQWADVMVIVPATANVIGKIANGIADDLLSLAAMAAKCPVVVVPNMNEHMYNRGAVQRNLRTLVEDGYFVIEPSDSGAIQLSTGQVVKG